MQGFNEGIDHYLEHLIDDIDTTGTWIKLRTLVNEQQTPESYNLIRWRMDALRNRIVMKGMPEKHVLLGAQDEAVPAGCIPEEFERATDDWIALIFTK
jgi:hypothetical protein